MAETLPVDDAESFCIICHDPVVDEEAPSSLRCGHAHCLHRVCLERWARERWLQRRKPACPLCMTPLECVVELDSPSSSSEEEEEEEMEDLERLCLPGLFCCQFASYAAVLLLFLTLLAFTSTSTS